jgi:hypothetical protein
MRGPQFPDILTDAPIDPTDLPEGERLISIKEAQHRLADVTRREIYNRIKAGDLVAGNIGRRRVILESSLVSYIKRSLQSPAIPKQRAGAA